MMSECEKCTDSYYYKRYKIVQAELQQQAEKIRILNNNISAQKAILLEIKAENQRLKELFMEVGRLALRNRHHNPITTQFRDIADQALAAPPQKDKP